jgi:hypothetical protein
MLSVLIYFISFLFLSPQTLVKESQSNKKISIGMELSNIELENAESKKNEIPDFGNKPVVVFYTDPDCKDINDPLSNAIKEGGFKDKIAGIGISNCDDSWIPLSLIRKGAMKKEKQFPGSVLLLDRDKFLVREWTLGNCNNLSLVIVIGQDMKVKYLRYINSEEESVQSIPEVIGIIEKEIKY